MERLEVERGGIGKEVERKCGVYAGVEDRSTGHGALINNFVGSILQWKQDVVSLILSMWVLLVNVHDELLCCMTPCTVATANNMVVLIFFLALVLLALS